MFNPLKELKKAGTTLDGFYRGVVVDNQSPKKDGRIRVKIFGVYDDLIPDVIPWAEPALPINTGGKLDQGSIFVPELDSFVFCFFDGGDVNHPIYFAMCPSIKDEEPDIPREAREEKLDETYLKTRRDERIENIDSADETEWSEPEPWYDAEYPYNHVIKLSNGIVLELDNTPTRERIHIYHPSNSLIEIDKNGNMHVRNSQDKYVLTIRNRKEYVGGDNILDVDQSRFIRVRGDERKKVEIEHITWVQDKEHLTVESDRRESIANDRDLTVSFNKRETVGADKHSNVDGNKVEHVGGDLELDIGGAKLQKVGGNFHLEIGGNLSFKVGGNFLVDASKIHFQEGMSSSVSPSTPEVPKVPTKPDEETTENED